MPAGAWTYTQAFVGFMNAQLPSGSARAIEMQHTNAGAKRNALIEKFLTNPALQWIYFNDSDHVLRPDTVLRLLSHNLPVVGGLYLGRVRYGAGLVWSPECGFDDSGLGDENMKSGKLVEVHWLGGGSLLIQRHVLESISAPWFPPANDDEDLEFCRRVRCAGFTIHVDTGMRIAHLQVQPVVVA